MTPRYLFKCALSLLATLSGAMLLLADSTDDCESYEALQASLDFTTDCPFAPSQGHLLLNFPTQGSDGRERDRELAESQLKAAGLSVVPSSVALSFGGGPCSGGSEGVGRITGIAFHATSPEAVYVCGNLNLPVNQFGTMSCNRAADASAPPRRDSGADASADSRQADIADAIDDSQDGDIADAFASAAHDDAGTNDGPTCSIRFQATAK